MLVLVCYGFIVVLYIKDLCEGCLILCGIVDMVEFLRGKVKCKVILLLRVLFLEGIYFFFIEYISF